MQTICHLRLLGPIQIERAGQPVRGFRSRKALALLGYLAVQGRPVPREQLADMFWEDEAKARGLANLSWVLHRISALLPDCLEADRHTVCFQKATPYRLDIDAFAELEAQGEAPALATAVELYRGEFLEGLYLDGCAEFELWLVGERERWRQRLSQALETLVAHYSRCGEHEQSLRFANRLLALEPWHEEIHCQVMRLLARNGQRSAALAQYETCRRVLAEELGVRPLAETTALYERIRAASSARSTTLPLQPTPFVGRGKELAEATALLGNPDCRLLTVLGPGGVGKTRLALQAAEARSQAFLEGVYFIPLASVSAPEFLVSAIADALQFSFSGPQDPRVQLVNYLRGKEVLLVLDNLEHLLDGTELLLEILHKAPEVKLLITSRERLNVRWEWCFEIGGLEYPAEETAEELDSYSAVRLFRQTARRVSPRLALSVHDEPAMQRICQLVEGMPLGIELAAAWVGTRTCMEIAREIERNQNVLATSLHDVPERHRSMWATFEHSWRLLAPSEQHVLMNLSVFRRGFQPEAAAEVTGASPAILQVLADKSLLRLAPPGRYEMHELLRQYAAEKLAAAPPAQTAAHDRHCTHYAAFLQRRETDLVGAGTARALAAIRVEIENVRAAWQWAATQARLEELERSSNGLSCFYLLVGPFQEGEALFGMAVEHVRALVHQKPGRGAQTALSKLLVERARLLNARGTYEEAIAAAQEAISLAQAGQSVEPEAAGHLQWGDALLDQGSYEEARSRLEQALRLAQAWSLRQVEASALRSLGTVSHSRGDCAEAAACYERSLRVSREIDDRRSEARALGSLGNVSLNRGDYAAARAYYEQTLQICCEIGDRSRESIAFANLALIAHYQGDYVAARGYHEQALRISRELGDRRTECSTLTNLGNVWFEQGDYDEARVAIEQALRISRETGHRFVEGLALNSLGIVCAYQGDYVGARTYCEQALRTGREIGDRRNEGIALSNLGLILRDQGDDHTAHVYSQQALCIAQELGERRLQGYVLSRLGHALVGQGRLSEAEEVYRQAVNLRRELGQPRLAMESLAGLAHVSLAQGDLAQAQTHVGAILSHLETGSLDGTDEPFQVYLTCYRVLRAAGDPRAQAILSTAYRLLQERAARIGDETLRRSFLENVVAHREIAEEMRKASEVG